MICCIEIYIFERTPSLVSIIIKKTNKQEFKTHLPTILIENKYITKGKNFKLLHLQLHFFKIEILVISYQLFINLPQNELNIWCSAKFIFIT